MSPAQDLRSIAELHAEIIGIVYQAVDECKVSLSCAADIVFPSMKNRGHQVAELKNSVLALREALKQSGVELHDVEEGDPQAPEG